MNSDTANIIIETQYFPCLTAMKAMVNSSNLSIEQNEHYEKMSFRNRSIITGSNGLIALSIPLTAGRNQRSKITEVRIDNSVKWQDQHWKSIVSCYGKAPFFDYFEMKFGRFFKDNYETLFDYNNAILKTLLSIFKSPTLLSYTDTYEKEVEGYKDLRNTYLPKNYNQVDKEITPYNQVFLSKLGFVPNLSIIDYLCCEGIRL